jgi:hypothetical protein
MDDNDFGYSQIDQTQCVKTSQEQDETATKTTKSGRIVFCDLPDKIGKMPCVACMSPITYAHGESRRKVKAQTRTLGSTQLAIRIIHNTHVGRVRRVHVRSETVHRSE